MKFKTLRKIETKEFVVIRDIGGGNSLFFTMDVPDPKPMSATIEGLKEYHNEISPLSPEYSLDDLELVEMECFESGEVGADIRNKLGPVKNLVTLIKQYLGKPSEVYNDIILEYIEKEMKNTERTIEYLSNKF